MTLDSGSDLPSNTTTQPLPSYVSQLQFGLGWDAQPNAELDLDLAVLALTSDGKLAQDKEGLIYAGRPRHLSGAIRLLNDSTTGEGDGDDERLLINLLTLPSDITKLIFVININCGEEQQQDFGQVHNAFWRLLDGSSQEVLVHQPLTGNAWDGLTTLRAAVLDRLANQWQLTTGLAALPFNSLNALLQQYL